MPKRKAEAVVLVADGSGGMGELPDLRFETKPWPIEVTIPSEVADAWMAHVDAEAEERGWNASAFSQLDRIENSGTLSLCTSNGQSPPTLDIVWERLRGGDLRLRARPSGDPVLPTEMAQEFIDAVTTRQLEGRKLRAHRRDLITYNGLPWRGELWLDEDHRLGPPSKFPEALVGPQIVIVDAMVEGVGQKGVNASFERRTHEVRVFLGFLLGLNPRPVRVASGWVYDVGDGGRITGCVLRPVGYVELSLSEGFPVSGNARPIERREVARPGLGPMGIWSDMKEQWVPDDIEELWVTFRRLPDRERDQLIRAGNAYLIARSMWPDQRTAYATFLVVALETLRPPKVGRGKMSIFYVVASMLGDDESKRLRALVPNPYGVRSRHVHSGELAAGELLPLMVYDHFADPSFDGMISELSRITRTCLIEWLRREGSGARD